MTRKLFPALAVVVLVAASCAKVPMIDFSLNRNALRLTTVDHNAFDVTLRFGPIADNLKKDIDQSVNVHSNWDIRCISVHFEQRPDAYHLLYLDPVQFCRLNETVKLTPIAVRKNFADNTTETGLIVVPQDSPIESLLDIKDKRFAFGPYGSPYMFYNVLELLTQSKIPIALLKPSYTKTSLEVVQRLLVFNLADVGVVTETWYETTTDRTLDLSGLLKDKLRVIGKTKSFPEYIWACSDALPPEKALQVRTFLTEENEDRQQKLFTPLAARAFDVIGPQEMKTFCQRFSAIKNVPAKPLLTPDM